MYIEEIILDGFKSYSTRTVVGKFDPQFTAITGLNGSGKSNILDSICFVLGISNLAQVRVHNLQELVYKQGQAGIIKASVTIVFNNENKNMAPPGFDTPKIQVTRQIVIGGKNKYMINGHLVQQQQVQNLFHSVQLNVNNPHFLIMQGRITKVINMKPPEILGMIEEAAGTRMYETKKEASLKLMHKKQLKVDEIHRILAEDITPTLEKLGQERANYLRWASNNNEVERLSRFCTAADYTHLQDIVQQGQGELDAMQQSANELEEKKTAAETKLKDLVLRIDELMKSREDAASNKLQKLETKKAETEKALVTVETQLQNVQQSIADQKKVLKDVDKATAEAQKAKDKKQKELDTASKAHADAEKKKVDLATTVEQLEKRLVAVNAGAEDDGQGSLQEQLMAAQTEMSKVEGDSQRFVIELKTARTALAPAEKELAKCEKEGKEVANALKRKREEVQKAQAALQKVGFDPRKYGEVEVKFRQEKQKLQECQEMVNERESQLARVNFHYQPPDNFNPNKVKGVVARLFEMKGPFQSYSTAVEVCAGGRLFYVVVDNENTAKMLLNQPLKRRVTIIPLTKIASHQCTPAQVTQAKKLAQQNHGEVHHAMEIVGYEKEVQAAMQYVFGGVLVCDSPETAKLVTFHPQVRVRTVTRQGDVYDPAGTVEGGSAPKTGDVLGRLNELRKLTEQLEKLRTACGKTSDVWADQCKLRDEADKRQQEVSMKEHDLKLTEEKIRDTEHGAKLKHVEELRAAVTEREQGLGSIEKRRKEAKDKVAQLEKAVSQFANNKQKMAADLEKQITTTKKEAQKAEEALNKSEQARSTLQLEMDACNEDMASVDKGRGEAEKAVADLTAEEDKTSTKVNETKSALAEVEAKLQEVRQSVAKSDKEHKELVAEQKKTTKEKDEAELDHKKVTHQIQTHNQEQDSSKKKLEALEREQPWILQEKGFFNKPGTDYDFQAHDYQTVRAKLTDLQEEQRVLSQSVNKKVVGMFEKAEEEHKDLLSKREIILRDKEKIENVIMDLDRKKKEAIEKTHTKVSNDFGKIFSTLLPNVNAKLDVPENMTCDQGLEIKVAFNGVWKQSLTELSGGQKSLLALSLVLALLLFKPAPMYILDEIDAALDLSHTQNIGSMIRQHFPHSQFIVVSLKEGMFQNASVLFRTRFVDGNSQVERHTLRDREAAEERRNSGAAALEDKEKAADKEPPRKRKKGLVA